MNRSAGHDPGRSPLRSKSRSHSRSIVDQSMPGGVHQSQLPPPSQAPLRSRSASRSPPHLSAYEDNQERMRVSQERIASILGLDRHTLARPGGAPLRPPPGHPVAVEPRVDPIGRTSPYMEAGRGRSPAMEGLEHPLRYSREASREHPEPQLIPAPIHEPPFATSMVKQSLADLKSRLQQMRQEKQQIERELSQFEQSRGQL